jgi:hypothetical protein
MKKLLGILVLGLLVFSSSANATWTVKELSDNQIAAYVRGEVNLYNRVIFFFRKENCSKPAHYFVLNTKSSKEELPILVNGIKSIVPITKSDQTASGGNTIFLFNGYNSPETFVSYFSKKDQVKVQIANTNFVEHFDVSGIQAVFKGAMELCLE